MVINEDFENKVNFIDENDVFVGYDLSQSCCEYADWFLTDKKNLPKDFSFYDSEKNKSLDVSGYNFDTDYFEDGTTDEGGYVAFRLKKKNSKNIYLYLFNMHNGYYSHGFTAKVGGQVWQAGHI